MRAHYGWRLILILPTILVASFLIFALMRSLPGDVVFGVIGNATVDRQTIESLRAELGLNQPLVVQYGRWLVNFFNGTFGGTSLETGQPIRDMVYTQFPVTFWVAGYAFLLSIIGSILLGVVSAYNVHHWPDYLIRLLTLIGSSLPAFLTSIVILLGVLFVLGWTPPIVYESPWDNPLTHIKIMVLPALILAWEHCSLLVRVTRSSILAVMAENYITTAHAKGLPRHVVFLRHALRNASIPIVSATGIQFTTMLGGTLVIETIFGLPGAGRGLVHAAIVRDYPVIQTFGSLMVALSLTGNMLIDLINSHLDPRFRQ